MIGSLKYSLVVSLVSGVMHVKAWIPPSRTSLTLKNTGTFPRSTLGLAPTYPHGSSGRIRLSCIAPCPMISFTYRTLGFPICLMSSSTCFSAAFSLSSSLNASRISCVSISAALCAAIGPGRSIWYPSSITTCTRITMSSLSGAPGRPNITFSLKMPSDEAASEHCLPLSSTPVSITTTPPAS